MRRSELQRCCVCAEGVAHDRQLLSTRVRVTRFGLNLSALRRQSGLEMMLGSPMLAAVMGPDEDLLKELEPEVTLMVCDQCAARTTVAELWSSKPVPADGPEARA